MNRQEEISRKRYAFVNINAKEQDSSTLKNRVEEMEINFDDIELVRGNNKKHMPYKNSFKRRVLDEIGSSGGGLPQLPFVVAYAIPRVTVFNSRGCSGSLPFSDGDPGSFRVYYRSLEVTELGEKFEYFLDPQGLLSLRESAYLNDTILLYQACSGINYDAETNDFYPVPVF